MLGFLIPNRNALDVSREKRHGLSRFSLCAEWPSPVARIRPGFGTVLLAALVETVAVTIRDLVPGVAAGSDLTKSPRKKNSLKEVIQPHLPVRLPCYDFTPLTGHSFGASVPCGFGQRLREHQTRVV